jgi:hypothetical protein
VALVQCPASKVKDAARIVAAVLDVPVGRALALCRDLPVELGRDLERPRAAAIAADFQAAGITLEMRGYRAFPWMEAPALG